MRGRKTGRTRATAVDVLELSGKRFIVAGRGRTEWVRNAEAAGEVSLKKGARRWKFRLRSVSDTEKPEILRAYVGRFKPTVQRYFPVPAGSSAESFGDVAKHYPVFELIPLTLKERRPQT